MTWQQHQREREEEEGRGFNLLIREQREERVARISESEGEVSLQGSHATEFIKLLYIIY